MDRSPLYLSSAWKRLAVLLALTANAVLVAPASGQAGQVLSATGEVQVRRASGQTVPGLADLSIGEGDAVLTGPDSEAQLRMVDDARLTIRANTQVKVQTYRYAGREDGNERGIISLLSGVLRSITGAIGRTNKDNLLVRTPNATIGIRGTDHISAYVPHADPARPDVQPGTYDKVTSGETFIEAHGQRVVIAPEQAGFAGLDPRVAPIRLREIPAFLRGDGRHGDASGKAKGSRDDQPERVEKVERVERVERTERVERIDRVERAK